METDAQSVQRAFDAFRAMILADAGLQDELQAYDDVASFSARASILAGQRGVGLTADVLSAALRHDPLGLSRRSEACPSSASPGQGWLPVNISPMSEELCVDWAYFGAQSLIEPFFEGSVRTAFRRPLNRLARYRTRLADLPQWTKLHPGLEPSGFIFHMSRCGSTLVSQMLATDARNIVISEAAPIDKAVQIDRATGDEQGQLLASAIGALGQKRSDRQCRYFLKFDSWHTRALPMFRRIFPSVPWIFLYREPTEVLASQRLRPGMHMVPSLVPSSLFGLEPGDGIPSEQYGASVLNRICEAVLLPYSDGGGLLVNYSELPQAVWTKILPHFGIAFSDADRAAMSDTALYDAKTPGMTFSPDAGAERRKTMSLVRPVAEQYLGDIYRRLEALRLGT
jgi:hypothetical protein